MSKVPHGSNSPPEKSVLSSQESSDMAAAGGVDEAMDTLQGSISACKMERQGHWIVDTYWFNISITVVVGLNTLQMGIEADHPELTTVWLLCENFFTTAFFIEMVLKIYVLRWEYAQDTANWMDALLTSFGVLDCWILALFAGDAIDLQSMSILRILRLARLARVVRLARGVKQFVLVICGVFKALVTTCWVFLLLVFVIYVCAIFCTEYLGRGDVDLYPGYSVDEAVIDEQELMANYNPYLAFGSMRNSMLTLFNIAIGGEWAEIVRPLAVKQPFFVVLMALYSMMMAFGLMNVMMAIIVDSVIAESKKLDKEMQEQKKSEKRELLSRIEGILKDLDSNDDDAVDVNELKKGFETIENLKELLSKADLPAGWSPSELLFMLDNSGDGVLQKNEFKTSFFRLIDSDDFQEICIMQSSLNQVKHLVRQAHDKLEIHMAEVRQAIREIHSAEARQVSSIPLVADTELDGESDTSEIHCDYDEGDTRQGRTKIDTELDGENNLDEVHCDYDESSKIGVAAKTSGSASMTNGPNKFADRGLKLGTKLAAEQGYCVDAASLCQQKDSGTLVIQPPALLDMQPQKSVQHALVYPSAEPTFTGSWQSLDQEYRSPAKHEEKAQQLRADIKSIPFQKVADLLDATFLAMKDSLYREFAVLLQAEEMSTINSTWTAVNPVASNKCINSAEGSSCVTQNPENQQGASCSVSFEASTSSCNAPKLEKDASGDSGGSQGQPPPGAQADARCAWQALDMQPTSMESLSKAQLYADDDASAAAGEDFVSVESGNHLCRCVDIAFDSEEKLGFEIQWYPGQLPLVGRVMPGSASSWRGVLQGDQLTQCNGISMADKCRQDALLLLKQRPLRLTVQRTYSSV